MFIFRLNQQLIPIIIFFIDLKHKIFSGNKFLLEIKSNVKTTYILNILKESIWFLT